MPLLSAVQGFVAGWRFPVLVLTVVGSVMLLLLAVLLVPATSSASAFAEDFKVWCFGYDPATGTLEWAYVWMFLVQPLVLVGVVLVVWWQPLRDVVGLAPWRIVPYVAGAMLAVGGLGAAAPLALGSAAADDGDLPFPAERLRTHHRPLPFALTDQDGEALTLEALRGRVVLLTAVYARCGDTCPLILTQTRRAVASLAPEERDGLTVVAVTMDPANDTPPVLKHLMGTYGLAAPTFRAATGVPGDVERILDGYGFARTHNPDTGVIEHVNLLVLIDRAGSIAYRFSLGERQEQWLTEALRLLLREDPPDARGG